MNRRLNSGGTVDRVGRTGVPEKHIAQESRSASAKTPTSDDAIESVNHRDVADAFHKAIAISDHERAKHTLVKAGIAEAHAQSIVESARNSQMAHNAKIKKAIPTADAAIAEMSTTQRISTLMREKGMNHLEASTVSMRIDHRAEKPRR